MSGHHPTGGVLEVDLSLHGSIRSAGTREYRWLMLSSWQRTDRFGDKSQRRDATADRCAPWWWWWWWFSNWSLLLIPKICFYACQIFSQSLCFVAKQYILQQKCMMEWIGSANLGTRWYNLPPPTLTLSATMHSVTDRSTTVWLVSWLHRVTIRLANNNIHHAYSVVFLKPTVSIRPSDPPSSSHKCLRFGPWPTLST